MGKNKVADMAEISETDVEIFQQFESFDFDNDTNFQEGWQSILKRLGNDANRETFNKAKVFFFSRQVMPFNLDKYLVWKKTKENGEELWNGNNATLVATTRISLDTSTASHFILNQSTTQSVSECSSIRNGKVACGTASSPEARQGANITTQSCEVISVSDEPELTQDDISESKMLAANPSCVSSGSFKHSIGNNSEISLNDNFKAAGADASALRNSSPKELSQLPLSLAELAELIQNQQPIPGLIKLDVQPTNASPTPTALVRKPKPWQMNLGEVKPSVLDTS